MVRALKKASSASKNGNQTTGSSKDKNEEWIHQWMLHLALHEKNADIPTVASYERLLRLENDAQTQLEYRNEHYERE